MIVLSSGARALLEVISVRAINWISLYTSRSKAIEWISVLISVTSSGNINRRIQLIIDAINYKMLKGKYLVGMLEVCAKCSCRINW